MKLDITTRNKLKRFAKIFLEARERDENEANTVMYLTSFLQDVLGYSALDGEITKEFEIKDHFCDLGIKINNKVKYLIEVKAVSNKSLKVKDIEQAELYAIESQICWVLLTNGIEWKLFHVSANKENGIERDEILSFNFTEDLFEKGKTLEMWNKLRLLSKESIKKDELGACLQKNRALSSASLIKVLSGEKVLKYIKRVINHTSKTPIKMEDIIGGLNKIISDEAHEEGGYIKCVKPRMQRTEEPFSNISAQSMEIQKIVQVNQDLKPDVITEKRRGLIN